MEKEQKEPKQPEDTLIPNREVGISPDIKELNKIKDTIVFLEDRLQDREGKITKHHAAMVCRGLIYSISLL